MKYFGTDGYRGKVNDTLTVINALKLGQGFGQLVLKLQKSGYVYVGQDPRLSSQMLVNALIAGLNSVGVDVKLLNVVTTPLLAYVTNKDSCALGAIMVSASHNPFFDNGLKCFNQYGFKLDADSEEYIERVILGEENIVYPADEHIGRVFSGNSSIDDYVSDVCQYIGETFKYRVVLDCANGSCYDLAIKLFKRLGFDVVVMNNEPNGININEHCGSTHLDSLKSRVVLEKADFGFAFDGDGDRVLAVDEYGREISGDHILYQMAKYFGVEIVTTVMANYGLVSKMRDTGYELDLCPVGDKYVYEELVKRGLMIGGEQSGHIIFRDFNQTGDGIFIALMIAKMLKNSGKKMADWYDELVIFPQLLVNQRVSNKEQILSNADLIDLCKTIDKELLNQGRLLVRASGTEPLIRVMVEAKNQEVCKLYVEQVVDLIKKIDV